MQWWKTHDMWLIYTFYTWNVFQFLEANSEQRYKICVYLDNIVLPVSIVCHWHNFLSHCTTFISMHFHAFPLKREVGCSSIPLSFLVGRGGSNCRQPATRAFFYAWIDVFFPWLLMFGSVVMKGTFMLGCHLAVGSWASMLCRFFPLSSHVGISQALMTGPCCAVQSLDGFCTALPSSAGGWGIPDADIIPRNLHV